MPFLRQRSTKDVFFLWGWHNAASFPLLADGEEDPLPKTTFCLVLAWPGLSERKQRGASVEGNQPSAACLIPGKSLLLTEKPERLPPKDLYAVHGKRRLQSFWMRAVLQTKPAQRYQEQDLKWEAQRCCTPWCKRRDYFHPSHHTWHMNFPSSPEPTFESWAMRCRWRRWLWITHAPQLKPCTTRKVSGRLCAVLVPKENMEELEASFANFYLPIWKLRGN